MATGRRAACAALFLLCAPEVLAQSSEPRVEPYVFRSYDGQETPAAIGRITVPSSRHDGSARTLTLAYVKLPTTAARPGPPIVFLAGGPGIPGVGIGQVPPYAALFRRLQAVSDVILLDQRGTGMSEPSLICEREPLPLSAWESEAGFEREFGAALTRCAAASRARGVDPADFNTEEAAHDLEALRRAIGAERLNLLAWSYGTEVALVALRLHPASFDRVVLAGVRPPGRLLKSPRDWEAQFRRLSALAAADPTAAALTPDLFAATARQVDVLRTNAIPLVLRTRAGREVRLNASALALQLLIRQDLSDLRAAGRLPALIGSLERGDTELFRARMEQAYNGLAPSLTLAVDCASGWSQARRRRVDREARNSLLRPVNIQWSPALCAATGARDLGAAYRRPVRSNATVLFISGTLDPNTPVTQAVEALRGFPNASHVVFENGGHESLPVEQVQAWIVRMLSGERIASGRVTLPVPRFATIEEALRALQPPPQQPAG